MENLLARDLDHILDHTRDLWEEFRGMRIFITGGTGFFGCWLLESLIWANEFLNLGAAVTVLTRSPQAFRKKAPHLALNPMVNLLAGDVRSFEYPQGNFSHVIHAATEASAKLNAEAPLEMFETIVEGTRHTLEFARQHGVRKFLLTSSGAVYGKQPPELTHIPETYPGGPDPQDSSLAYAGGKRAAEQLCALYSRTYDLQVTTARCFAFVGPYLPLNIHFAIGNFILDGLQGRPIVVKGDGTPMRSYLYAADLAIWLWTILFKGTTGEAYNVGSPDAISIRELAEQIGALFSPSLPVHVLGDPVPDRVVERYVPDIEKARRELGLVNWIDLREAVNRTLQWHLSNGKS